MRGGGVAHQHVEDAGDAMRESDPLGGQQPEQHLGDVAAGIHLFHADHGGDVGDAPGVHVEHRRERHVDVVATQPSLVGRGDRGQ